MTSRINRGASIGVTRVRAIASALALIPTIPLLILSVGCDSRSESNPAPQPIKVMASIARPEVDTTEPKQLGSFQMTFYYVAEESSVGRPKAKQTQTEDVELAATTGDQQIKIFKSSCEPITEVSREFASQLALQGTGKLRDGRLLNVSGHCSCEFSPCFKVTETKWGTAGTGRALQPFRTVAVDPKRVKLGSLLHIPELEGRTMPGRAPWGGFVHDGCVVADDTGGGIKGKQLDLFVGRKAYYQGLKARGGSHDWARKVEVFDGSKICERSGRRVGRKGGSI
jgi:3D (Asp-Asp-Asp) domain-containing protein